MVLRYLLLLFLSSFDVTSLAFSFNVNFSWSEKYLFGHATCKVSPQWPAQWVREECLHLCDVPRMKYIWHQSWTWTNLKSTASLHLKNALNWPCWSFWVCNFRKEIPCFRCFAWVTSPHPQFSPQSLGLQHTVRYRLHEFYDSGTQKGNIDNQKLITRQVFLFLVSV